MKVFFNPAMSTESFGYSPSASKPSKAVADWLSRGLDIQIVDFEPATELDVCLAHDTDYVRGVLSGKIRNGHGNLHKSVADSCLWTCGSILAAARSALTDGITCSPTSGFHHACFARNSGYCTFNGLMIAAIRLIKERRVSRVGIVDCDAHFGNGTEDIIHVRELQDFVPHWTYGRDLGDNFCQRTLLESLGCTIRQMKADGVDLVIYQAGADPHIDDPLGGDMTTEEMRQRDQFVFELCADLGLPVSYTHAGGYNLDAEGGIGPVLEIHRNTALEAIEVLQRFTGPAPLQSPSDSNSG